MYFYVVPLTFAACSVLLPLSFYLTGASVDTSCSRVSFLHHFIAMLLGMYAHWTYRDSVQEHASFGLNTDFPVAVVLQHFNIGYFLYDSINVTTWDQRFWVHHMVALAGYGTSEVANVFALSNAVNTWITEIGSLLYQLYLLLAKSDSRMSPAAQQRSYVAFVVVYALTRAYFAYWSLTVFGHVRASLISSDRGVKYPSWAPYDAAFLQVMLLGINLLFLWTHVKKLMKGTKHGSKQM